MGKFMKLLPLNFTSKSKFKKSTRTLNNALETPPLSTMTDPPVYMYNTSELQAPVTLRISPNFILVWLDAHIDVINNIDCRNTLNELRKIVNTIKIFVDVNQCMNFLINSENEKVFLIVSGSLGQHIVPLVHHICQLTSIYIFCEDKSRHEHWGEKWTKIKGVFTEISPICHELKPISQQSDRDSIPISIVSTNNETLTTEFNHLDQSFMNTQILKEILLDIDFDKKSMKDFIIYCRNQFANDEKN